LTELRQGLTELRQALTELRQGLTELRQALTELRHVLTELRQALTELRQALTEFRQALTELRQALTELRQTLLRRVAGSASCSLTCAAADHPRIRSPVACITDCSEPAHGRPETPPDRSAGGVAKPVASTELQAR
jgi:ABC-type transporter Mla subunit MlaD